MSDPGRALYLDSSALVKLIHGEKESVALGQAIREREAVPTSSELAEIELIRAVRRRVPDLVEAAESLLDRMVLLPVTRPVRTRAKSLRPTALRGLDAIHIATVLEIAPHLDAITTYDRRMIEAAESLGLPVSSPGLPA